MKRIEVIYPKILIDYLDAQHCNGIINIPVADCFVLQSRTSKEFLQVVAVVNYLHQYQIPINLN
jgi:hypothetical protein